jgi:hypothetical protein
MFATARSRSRTKAVIVLLIVAFPVVTLLLAKLFQSDVLGWIFGLTLMFGLAMLPFVAIVYLGLKLWSRRSGKRERAADQPVAVPADPGEQKFTLNIERSGVHASDDSPPKRITLHSSSTLREMLNAAVADAYLPTISGGKSTWVVESTAGRPIAVCAEQWAEPLFLVPAETRVLAHFREAAPSLNFRYRCQEDPDAVASELISHPVTAAPPSQGSRYRR